MLLAVCSLLYLRYCCFTCFIAALLLLVKQRFARCVTALLALLLLYLLDRCFTAALLALLLLYLLHCCFTSRLVRCRCVVGLDGARAHADVTLVCFTCCFFIFPPADMLSVLRSAAHADVTLVASDSVQIPGFTSSSTILLVVKSTSSKVSSW